jgi:hypothetical protein
MTRLAVLIPTSAVVATMTFAAWAQSPALPTPKVEEVMVKTSLLSLNDANLTGDYNVLYAKMAKPFRERFSADTLKQAFASFAGHHIDAIAGMAIVATSPPGIDANGALHLRGYFDTTPSRLSYELDYAASEGEWKLIAIDVKVRSQSTNASATDLVARAAADVAGAKGPK